MNFDITYWNNTIFSLKDNLGYKEIKIEDHTIHKLLPLYSRARKRVELNVSRNKFNDDVYPTYKFPFNYKGLKKDLVKLNGENISNITWTKSVEDIFFYYDKLLR